MGRRFLPALRGPEVETKALAPSGLESKTISFGGGYSSVVLAGVNRGFDDRAAGWDMATVIINGYEQAVWVFRSLEFIAGHQSRLPFRIAVNKDSDDEQVVDDHPLYRVLNKQANPLETGRQFRKRLSQQVYLSKRGAFVEVGKSRMGTITRLDLLPPDRVRPVPSESGEYLSHFEFITRHGELREIAPERIRWVREPHPTDPFCGTTPLEPAGASVELDSLARLYNSQFIKNDGRPGGIVGVDTDGLEDDEVERIEARFAPGAQEAGKITAIGTGPGGIKYVDTTTKPRDMAYSEMSENAKNEILSAIGLGESVLGNASGRTYDNAEQELYNAWSEVLLPHFDLIASAFDQDVPDEWEPFIDTSSVHVLELPRRKRREEARQEMTQGARSVNEYRPLAGLEPVDSPYARALWISPSKAPIPSRPEDAEALGVSTPGAQGSQASADVDTSAAAAVEEAREAGGVAPLGSAADAVAQARLTGGQSTAGDAAAAVADARADAGSASTGGGAAAAVAAARLEGKTLEAVSSSPVVYEPGEAEVERNEVALSGALDAMLARQLGVLTSRLESPKVRKGTKFWTPDGPGDTRVGEEPLDAAKVVDEDRWLAETGESMVPLLSAASAEAGAGLLAALAAGGVLAGSVGGATAAAEGAEAFTAAAGRASAATVLSVMTAAVEAMRDWLRNVQRQIEVGQVTATTVDEVVAAVRQHYAVYSRAFASNVAGTLAQAAVAGGREAAAAALVPMPDLARDLAEPAAPPIVRTWASRRDTRVRPSHRDADGETRLLGEPFQVGEALLRYPGDVLGPPQETYGCRCRLFYRTAPDARLLLTTAGSDEA